MKRVTSERLLELASDAEMLKFNRQLNTEKLGEDIDVEGTHILENFMLHDIEGCPPHVRCRVMMKLEGQDAPEVAWLDVKVEDYEALEDAEEMVE